MRLLTNTVALAANVSACAEGMHTTTGKAMSIERNYIGEESGHAASFATKGRDVFGMMPRGEIAFPMKGKSRTRRSLSRHSRRMNRSLSFILADVAS
jgi:hypothetical protein